MLLFYAPNIALTPQLPDPEVQHCLKVLRMKTGDVVHVTDGAGNFYKAAIAGTNPKDCRLNILETIPQPSAWKGRITIAIAPAKNMERTEWFAEKATEIGVDKIAFLHCRFSERKDVKTDRIGKILVAAMKQSLKARLPELQAMVGFKQFITQAYDGQKFIAHCRPGEKTLLSKAYHAGESALTLVGPEGDFSEEEIALAVNRGFIPVSLGESRLRTETAALIACQTIHIVNQIAGNE
ncbi:MAG: 16S rRNA (uracil(1498)-N(3))-methyltransferase [Dysgonamonadaceae bacterium]|jgi:16S rRNA (uracil1498-N3)-methyltransferase|nr:16S rRNA (uracil(1498)-N(3))-methyltransferase [Dysgonamonadaceae bacterium]